MSKRLGKPLIGIMPDTKLRKFKDKLSWGYDLHSQSGINEEYLEVIHLDANLLSFYEGLHDIRDIEIDLENYLRESRLWLKRRQGRQ